MDFTNALANDEEDLQDEDFYHDGEDSVEQWELLEQRLRRKWDFINWGEISSLEKFNEEGITLCVIPSIRFIDKTFFIETVVEAENTSLNSDKRE